MKDLIEALTILLKYGDPYAPTHCEHDVLTVMVKAEDVGEEDLARLDALGFKEGEDGYLRSFRFGSA